MTKLGETPTFAYLKRKYYEIYANVRNDDYPIEQAFMVTKIQFQEFIIQKMIERPKHATITFRCYQALKNDKKLPEKALNFYESRL